MSADNDKTQHADDVTRGTRDAATLAADLSMSGHALPAGTQLHDYVITGLLGEGGFGIVYLAEDAALQREVALKEYLPSSMASRAKNATTVMVKSANHQETFQLGLKSFVNEARLLARFDHPALVKVHRFWEANGTAYMVMPYYRGPTLKVVLAGLGHLPGEAEVRRWLWPLMDALAVMHAAHCFHRDIAPDNILITDNGPLLLDFGAARRVIGDMTHALTVVLKPGFAPIEQYGEIPGMTQGAWTDIYALASVLYAAISGRRPMPSVERLINDQLQPLAKLAAGRYPPHFLQAIDQALALRPVDRPQSIEAFRALLERRDDTPAARPPDARSEAYEKTLLAPPPMPAPGSASPPVPRQPTLQPMPPLPPPALVDADGGSRKPARRVVLTAVASGAIALAAGSYFMSGGRGAAQPSPAPAAASAPAVEKAPTAGPAPTPAVVVAPAVPSVAAAPEISSAPTNAPLTPPSNPSAPAPPTDAPVVPPEPEPAAAPTPSPAPKPAVTIAKPAARSEDRAPSPKSIESAARPAIATPAPSAETRAKCSDILQKATLEPLSASEQAYLRRECR